MTRLRRGRGEGGLHKRADGYWCATVSGGYDAKGKRRRRTVYAKTKTEVKEKLRDLVMAGKRTFLKDGKLTLERFLDHWLLVVEPTVEPNTYGPYERHCRRHITPTLGPVRLTDLEPGHVEELYASLTEKKVSAALQRKVGTTLTIALNKAVKDGLIPGNPAGVVRKPKAIEKDIVVLDPDQVATFLDTAKGDRFYAFYVTALDSGARPGELLALEWSHVNLEFGYLSISKSLEQIGDKQRVKAVKTKRGNRRIDLSQHAINAIEEHRKDMLAAGHITGPVFCNTKGGHVRISDLHKDSFKPILKRAGLPNIRLYDLRHTCATLLLLADEPAKVVSERLGHAKIQLTLDTYSHVLPTMQKRAASTMNAILGRKVKKAEIG